MLLIMYVYFFSIIMLHVIEGHIGMYVCVLIKVIHIGNIYIGIKKKYIYI